MLLANANQEWRSGALSRLAVYMGVITCTGLLVLCFLPQAGLGSCAQVSSDSCRELTLFVESLRHTWLWLAFLMIGAPLFAAGALMLGKPSWPELLPSCAACALFVILVFSAWPDAWALLYVIVVQGMLSFMVMLLLARRVKHE